jgi:small-conductance mechanosensitive channel
VFLATGPGSGTLTGSCGDNPGIACRLTWDVIRALMEQAASSMFAERGWRKLMLEKPEVWGAQELSSKEVTMRIVAKTAPMRQWEVARELRARVKAALDAAGVAPAGPDTIVITAPSPNGGQLRRLRRRLRRFLPRFRR